MSGKHLAIEATAGHLRFITLLNGRLLHSETLELPGDEHSVSSSLDQFIREHPTIDTSSDEVTLSWASQRSTLVPNAVFTDTSAEEIFRLCYGSDHDLSMVDYNRLSEHGVIHVFEMPLWLKRYFVLKFPRIIVQHEGSHVLRKVMQSAFYVKATLVLHADYFFLTIVKHNQLEFFGTFSCQSPDDVVYHLVFALQQKELLNERGSIEIISGCDAPENFAKEISEALPRIGDLKQMEIRIPEAFLAESQLLCV